MTRPTASAAGIVCLGASYMERGSPLPATLGVELGRPVEARGVRGATLERWLSESRSVAVGGQDVIVGEFGGNGVPTPDQIRDAHAALVARGAASVRWLTPPSGYPTPEVNARRVATTQAIRAAGVPVVAVSFSVRGKVARDGQHLTAQGYAELAKAYADRIKASASASDGAPGLVPTLIAGGVLWFLVR